MLQGIFVEILPILKGLRIERAKKHLFFDMFGLVLFLKLAGVQCFTEMEGFYKSHIVEQKEDYIFQIKEN